LATNNPGRARKLGFVLGFALTALALPAQAQGVSILRDTETEAVLKGYEMPLAKAAGLNAEDVKVYLAGNLEVNAFATQPADIVMFSGIVLQALTPNELIGVMAHETGHIAAGHMMRGSAAMQKAQVPMLLSLLLGVVAMAAGAGEAGMVIMQAGQAIAMANFAAFSRVQESTADQIAVKLLNATHQSPIGMYNTFVRFAAEEARSAYRIDPYAVDHPVGQDRVGALQDLVDASPYRDIKDTPEAQHAFDMMKAKLAGFVLQPADALNRYPLSDTSEPARYARTMVYMKKPDFPKALAEVNSLIKDEPDNPYFYEVLGQIYVSLARPLEGIPAYQKSVNLKPQAPQLRLGLATAQLATDNPSLAAEALKNLKAASLVENDDPFTWYQTARAYSLLKNEPMANLSTAEAYYNGGNMMQALVFSMRAQKALPQGSSDWQRAGDIIAAAGPEARRQRQ
jgi:predicted Zn-dependent protease